MDTPSSTVTLHRVLKASPEKVYRAFTQADAMASWLPPYGFLCVVHEMDARVGGSYKMSFTNFSTGNGHSFGDTRRNVLFGLAGVTRKISETRRTGNSGRLMFPRKHD